MKNYILFLCGVFLFSSCEKENTKIGEAYPITYFVYFDFFDVQGNPIDNNQIELSRKSKMKNGYLEDADNPGVEHWYKMGAIDSPDIEDPVLFGYLQDENSITEYVPLPFESTVRLELVKLGLENHVMDWYYLFRSVQDNSKIDTLRIHDVLTVEPYNREFDFFINEVPVEIQGDGKFDKKNPNYIAVHLK